MQVGQKVVLQVFFSGRDTCFSLCSWYMFFLCFCLRYIFLPTSCGACRCSWWREGGVVQNCVGVGGHSTSSHSWEWGVNFPTQCVPWWYHQKQICHFTSSHSWEAEWELWEVRSELLNPKWCQHQMQGWHSTSSWGVRNSPTLPSTGSVPSSNLDPTQLIIHLFFNWVWNFPTWSVPSSNLYPTQLIIHLFLQLSLEISNPIRTIKQPGPNSTKIYEEGTLPVPITGWGTFKPNAYFIKPNHYD